MFIWAMWKIFRFYETGNTTMVIIRTSSLTHRAKKHLIDYQGKLCGRNRVDWFLRIVYKRLFNFLSSRLPRTMNKSQAWYDKPTSLPITRAALKILDPLKFFVSQTRFFFIYKLCNKTWLHVNKPTQQSIRSIYRWCLHIAQNPFISSDSTRFENVRLLHCSDIKLE